MTNLHQDPLKDFICLFIQIICKVQRFGWTTDFVFLVVFPSSQQLSCHNERDDSSVNGDLRKTFIL